MLLCLVAMRHEPVGGAALAPRMGNGVPLVN